MSRRIVVAAVLLATIGCGRKAAGRRAERVTFDSFTLAVPAGWNRSTDAGVQRALPAGAAVFVLDRAFEGFAPSIVVQQVTMSPQEHQQFAASGVAECGSIAQQIAAQYQLEVGEPKVATVGALRGCDIALTSATTTQAMRQLTIGNGTWTVSIVCNRDKSRDQGVTGACDAFAAAITPN